MNFTRNILLATAVLLAAFDAQAQGIVRFANFGPGLNAPVTNAVTGQLAAGSECLVQLYAGAAGSLEPALLPISNAIGFNQGAGYFDGGLATNTFVIAGATGSFQVRAWCGSFSTYEQALSAALTDPNVLVGKSALFENSTGIASAATLTGLQGFAIAPVPEPSAIGLLALGAILLLAHRVA